ncbi:hypothetical protein Tco_0835209, partial [Tanacetum coccineum]
MERSGGCGYGDEGDGDVVEFVGGGVVVAVVMRMMYSEDDGC